MNKRGYLSERLAIALVVIIGTLGILFLLAGTGMLVYTGEASITGRATDELPTFSNQPIEENATNQTLESEITENQPPEFTGDSLRTAQGVALVVDLSELFTDAEGDELTFLVTEEDVIGVSVDGSTATFTPEPDFTGLRLITIAVTDGTNLLRESVKFVVESVELNETNASVEVNETNATIEINETSVNEANITANVTMETIELNETNITEETNVTNETIALNETVLAAEINLTTTEINETNETNTAEPEPPSFPSFSGQTFTSCEPGPILMNVSTTLTNNLATNTTCIEFNNDNITLDCNGFRISYTGARDAINATLRDNVSVINCEINDFLAASSESAIEFYRVTSGTIRNNFIKTNGSSGTYGIYLREPTSNSHIVTNNTIINRGTSSANYAIHLDDEVHFVNISNNTIISNGTSSNHGIHINDNSRNLTINNNVIFTGSTTTTGDNYGIELDSQGYNVFNNTIRTDAATGDDNYGIILQSGAQDGIIDNNSIFAGGTTTDNIGIRFNGGDDTNVTNNLINSGFGGGTSNNDGIEMSSSSDNNRFVNNRIFTRGSSAENRGIDLTTNVRGTVILNNTIFTNGTAENDGINLANSDENVIENNTISVDGTGASSGINLSAGSDEVNITGNIVRTDASTGGTNFGIVLGTSDIIIINNNTIITGGSLRSNSGIVLSSSVTVEIYNNTINASGSANLNNGIQLTRGSNKTSIVDNKIITNGTLGNAGIIIEGTENVTIARNTVLTDGSSLTNNTGIEILGFTGFTVDNNTVITLGAASFGIKVGIGTGANLTGNNLTTNAPFAHGVSFFLANSSRFINTLIAGAAWINATANTVSNQLTNTTFGNSQGSIRYVGAVTITDAQDIRDNELNTSASGAFVNSTALPFLNTSSQVTLRSLEFNDAQVIVDNDDGVREHCFQPRCSEVSYDGSTFVFDVSSFSTYSGAEGNLTIQKTDNADPVGTGDNIVYSLLLEVSGDNASNTTVTETYPNQVFFVTSQPAPLAGTNNTFIVGNLTSGDAFQLNITVQVLSGAAGTVINNTANVTYTNSTGGIISINTTESTSVIAGCPGNISQSTTLTADISSIATCVTIANTENVTLDCAGFTINYGLGGLDKSMGINVTNTTNVTVQNCNIIKTTIAGDETFGVGIFGSDGVFVHNSNVTTNGTTNADGIHVDRLSTSALFIPKGTFTVVEKGTNINNPVCTNITGVSLCNTCFTTGFVACTFAGLAACPDGEGFKSNTLVRFNTTFVPDAGDITIIGGEVVFCNLNEERIITLATGNNCGAVKSASFSSGFVAGENNLTCFVSGSGGEEDNGFKLASFRYTSPQSFSPGIIRGSSRASITNVTIFVDGGDQSRGVFLNSPRSNVTNSVINTTGNESSHGIFILADNTTIRDNNILTNAGERSHAIDIASDNAIVENNIINTTGGNQSHGIVLEARINGARVDNNTISVTPTGSDAINLYFASGNNFSNNTIIRAERAGILVERSLQNTFTDTFVPLQPARSSMIIEEINGIINYTDVINLSISTNLSRVVSIGLNNTFVNATDTVGAQLNKTALLSFFGLSGFDVLPVIDLNDTGSFLDCATSRCRNSTYNSSTGILTFNVSSFTTYAGSSQLNCGIVDLDTLNNETNLTFLVNRNFTSTGTCLSVVGDNITVLCNGTQILYDSNGIGGDGIVLSGTNDSEVRNCFIRDINSGGSFGIGVLLSGTNRSRIFNNTIITNGTISNSGVVFSSGSEFNIIENNTIFTFGTSSSNDGIGGSGGTQGNQYRGNIISTNGTGSNAGIEILSSFFNNHTVIFNNSINTTGSGSAFGINMQSGNNMTVAHNVIRTGGTGSSNFGITLGFSFSILDSFIINNVISTSGTSSNYGIDFAGSTNNVIANNTVNTTGTDQNYGLFVGSSDFIIRANTISTNGSADTNVGIRSSGTNVTIDFNNVTTDGGDCCNDGIDIISTITDLYILNNNISAGKKTDFNFGLFIRANGRLIADNFIRTDGTSSNGGILIDDPAGNITVENNTVLSHGSSADNAGIEIQSDNTNVTGNKVVTNGSLRNYGLFLSTGSSDNFFDQNNVTTTGGLSPSVRILRSNFSTFNNTILFDPEEWINSTVDNLNNFTNTTFVMPNGSISVTGTVQMNGSQQVSKGKLNVTDNNAYLNSTDISFLNTSAVITLRGITAFNPALVVDFDDDDAFTNCFSPQCNKSTYTANELVFNVASFTSYSSSEGNINISASKASSPGVANSSDTIVYSIDINNTGNTETINVTVTETYPSQVTFSSASPSPTTGNNVFALGNISPQVNFTLNISVTVNAVSENITINNTAAITFQNFSNDTITITLNASTNVTGSAAPPPPPAAGGGGGGGGGSPIGGVQPPAPTQPAPPVAAPPAVEAPVTEAPISEEPSEPVEELDVDIVPDEVIDEIPEVEVPYGCVESWTCEEWSSCFGIQTRKCVDNNYCGTLLEKPDTWQFCKPDMALPDLRLNIKFPQLPNIDLFKASLWLLLILTIILITYGTRKFADKMKEHRSAQKAEAPVKPKPVPKPLIVPKGLTSSDLRKTQRSLKATKALLDRYKRQLK